MTRLISVANFSGLIFLGLITLWLLLGGVSSSFWCLGYCAPFYFGTPSVFHVTLLVCSVGSVFDGLNSDQMLIKLSIVVEVLLFIDFCHQPIYQKLIHDRVQPSSMTV